MLTWLAGICLGILGTLFIEDICKDYKKFNEDYDEDNYDEK